MFSLQNIDAEADPSNWNIAGISKYWRRRNAWSAPVLARTTVTGKIMQSLAYKHSTCTPVHMTSFVGCPAALFKKYIYCLQMKQDSSCSSWWTVEVLGLKYQCKPKINSFAATLMFPRTALLFTLHRSVHNSTNGVLCSLMVINQNCNNFG